MNRTLRVPVVAALLALAFFTVASARRNASAAAGASGNGTPIVVGDSTDVSYAARDAAEMDVACVNCAPSLSYIVPERNTVRVFARLVANDTLTRSVCFSERGNEARHSARRCVSLKAVAPAAAQYSVPLAIREAEVTSLHPIAMETYDGTGQSAHPDFQRINVAWSPHKCWMVFTPYAGSQREVENPSLASSPDCEHWIPAAGVKAPLVAKPENGFNSDPDLMYDAAHGCLGVMFRRVTDVNSVLLTHSCNGTTWSEPRELFSVPNHGAISPTVTVGPDGLNRVWYVASGPNGCGMQDNRVIMRTGSSSGPLERVAFGDEIATDLAQPDWVIWHIKVRYIPEKREYWAMYAAYSKDDNGGCLNDDLFFATSGDGLHWKTYPVPILNHLDSRFNFESLYRASFIYEASTDRLRTIVSARDSVWGQFGVVHDYKALRSALDSSLKLAGGSLDAPRGMVRRPAESRVRIVVNASP